MSSPVTKVGQWRPMGGYISHLCGTNLHRGETDGRGDSDSYELVHCPRCRNLVIATGEPVCTACQEDGDD